MPGEAPELREVVERNAQAVMTGNFAQLMADITPEALGKLMQMMPAGGGPSLASLPAITGYDLEHLGQHGDSERYRACFASESGTVQFVTSWRIVFGQWKVVDFSDVEVQAASGSESAEDGSVAP